MSEDVELQKFSVLGVALALVFASFTLGFIFGLLSAPTLFPMLRATP